MPGPTYNNPQLELERERKRIANDVRKFKTEKENAAERARLQKVAAPLRSEIAKNEAQIRLLKDGAKGAAGINYKSIKALETDKATLESQLLNLIRTASSPPTSGQLAAIVAKEAEITAVKNDISQRNLSVKNLQKKNEQLKIQINALFKVKSVQQYNNSDNRRSDIGSTSSTIKRPSETERKPPKGKGEGPIGPHKYNLPLIKYAQFSTDAGSPLISSLGDNSNLVSPPGIGNNNAEHYWNEQPGRGVLRVNKEWMKAILNSSNEQHKSGGLDFLKDASVPSRKPDRQLYGFRFLFNPEKIQMVYDINADLHPGMISTGKDNFLPLTKSSSAVSLDLILTRMEDMKYREDPSLAIRNQVYFGGGETDSLLPDVQEIHEKGTMYDLEYLFKTMNAPHATFTSAYNGQTADMGFIRPTILELHLGNRLRYPVRVISLAIEHKIFDPRMVPIFSVVRMTFGRFIEFESKKQLSGGGGGANSGGGTRRVAL